MRIDRMGINTALVIEQHRPHRLLEERGGLAFSFIFLSSLLLLLLLLRGAVELSFDIVENIR